MPYDVSGHPKHPSIQLLVTHCLTVKHSHAAGSQKRPFTCFNLNPWCVQHIYQSVTERSPSDKLFFSLVAGAIPQTSCQTVLLFFTFYAHMKVVYIKRIFKFPYVTLTFATLSTAAKEGWWLIFICFSPGQYFSKSVSGLVAGYRFTSCTLHGRIYLKKGLLFSSSSSANRSYYRSFTFQEQPDTVRMLKALPPAIKTWH